MTTAMSTREAYKAGYEHGWSLASWNAQNIQFGMDLDKSIDWVGIGKVETVKDWLETFDMVISSADESSRCYSPFEITAAEINAREEVYGECASEDGWRAFERGLQNGASAYRRRYYPVRELRKDMRDYLADRDE